MKHTPEKRALQAYEDYRLGDIRTRYTKQHEFTPSLVSSTYSPLREPHGVQTLRMTFQGKYLRAHIITKGKQPPARGRRSVITDFSPGSRGRLFDLFNKMEIRSKVIFITLTYEKDETDAKRSKQHLRAFIKRLVRAYPKAKMGFVWRMEFQERGAIHFHICAFGLPFVPKENIQRIWGEVSNQERPFTRIEMIYSTKKVMNYVSKYVAKVNPSPEIGGFNLPTYLAAYQSKHGDEIGRVWGVTGTQNLPMAEKITIELAFNYAKFMQFRLIASHQFPPIWDSLSLGFRLYVVSAKQWEQYFHSIYDAKF